MRSTNLLFASIISKEFSKYSEQQTKRQVIVLQDSAKALP